MMTRLISAAADRALTRALTRGLTCCLRCCLALTGTAGAAEDPASPARWYDRTVQQIERTWQDGRPELYLPLHSHHLRSAYSRDQTQRFNEDPFGLGFGKGLYDRNGDWHGLFAMVFQESHSKPEYAVGYSYRTFWPVSGEFKVGLGLSAILTARQDFDHYMPFPLLLPIFSLEYRKFSLDTNYVPGGRGAGNVLFVYGRIPL